MKSQRLIAFEILYKIFYDASYSNLALDSALADIEENKSFISALVYGVVERRITIDYYLKKYIDKSPKPKIMTVLRLGAYQILYMDKVPDSAAINESVKLVKEIKQDFYSKLVNAVLHKVADDNEILKDDYLIHSIPEQLLNMWNKQYGFDTVKEFLPCLNGRPPVFAIPNKLFVDSDELLYELLSEDVECEVCDDVVKINSPIDFRTSRAYKNGLFHIEDLSSYECAVSLGARENDTVLDVCCAPGGKTFTIAQQMNNKGRIFAFDLYSHRLKLVNDGAKRLGINIIKTAVNDASVYNPDIPMADRILVDVPCSGFGIIRRKPEIRHKSLDSVKDLPHLQLDILETSSKYLKSGGVLIYSTCTLNKKENENVVKSFLKKNRNFTLTDEKTIFPSFDGGDGFYRAKLIKNND
ncbi:MAG: 16S rRNA (cytosine(967)-C(5))-methyltransferase RsmB [Eubacterium sp.]|nr:16S rRNA (cytosine(967)-C(5))-methyltransferase RsmB [Eubacterium sp.]